MLLDVASNSSILGLLRTIAVFRALLTGILAGGAHLDEEGDHDAGLQQCKVLAQAVAGALDERRELQGAQPVR